MFCVVAPQCTQPPCGSPTTRDSSQTSGTMRVAGAGEALVDARAVQQLEPRRGGDRLGRLVRDDAEFGLRAGQRDLDIEPGLPAVLLR